MPAEQVIAELIGRGEYLLACDAARDQIDRGSDDLGTRYLYVLSLARSGALDRATEMFSSLGLDALQVRGGGALEQDVVALGARLAKDRALRGHDLDTRLAAESARRYEELHSSTGSTYPGINAATMWLAAGDSRRAGEIARAVLARLPDERPEGRIGQYWQAATAAEASLVLGRLGAAEAALARASEANPDDLAARASTVRQLRMVCRLNGIDPGVLDALGNPPIVHFCGHRISAPGIAGRFRADEESRVVSEVRGLVEALAPLAGYGSLASGADTIVAEALLDAGAELHLWLPFGRDEFVASSVAPAGDRWVRRFEHCTAGATTVEEASTGDSMSDPVLYDYCARLAMGDALVRAGFLAAPVHQIAVWDGRSTPEVAGTAVDVGRWAETGNETTVIRVQGSAPKLHDPPAEAVRAIRALVFVDVAGFGGLTDSEVMTFDREVLTVLGARIDATGSQVLLRETWGDGIYLVFSDVASAAECALGLQESFASVDLVALGLTGIRGMRVGAHVGPVLQGWDPVADRARFSGSHVTRTARIEPRTPEGAVYVTRQFAASVALQAADRFNCEYVGIVPAAKDFGDVPMYVLTRTG